MGHVEVFKPRSVDAVLVALQARKGHVFNQDIVANLRSLEKICRNMQHVDYLIVGVCFAQDMTFPAF